MSPPHIGPERLLDLAEAVCDRIASQDELAELDSVLADDEASRRSYWKYCRMHVALKLDMLAQEGVRSVCKQIDAESVGAIPRLDIAENGTTSGITAGFPYNMATYLSSGWPVAYLIATVIFAIGTVVGTIIHVSHPAQVASQSDALHSPSESLSAVVGRITGMADCVFEKKGEKEGLGIRDWGLGEGSRDKVQGSRSKVQGSRSEEKNSSLSPLPSPLVRLGDQIALASGLLEITYETGAKVILQGPVTYKVDSADGGFLSQGKLTARVEKEVASGQWPVVNGKQNTKSSNHQTALTLALSQGERGPDSSHQPLTPSPSSSPLFSVRTPTAIVRDLGTEFGVEVARDGETDTDVFVGTVEVEVVADDGRGIRQMRTLGAREHAHVGIDRSLHVEEVSTSNVGRQFVRTIPGRLKLDDSYAQLVLSMNPVVYYRMEDWPKTGRPGHYVLVDSGPGGHHGTVLLDDALGEPSSRGKYGGAMHAGGPMSPKYGVVKNYPKSETDQLSVSLWVWATTSDPWAVIVSNWFHSNSDPTLNGGQFGMSLDDKGQLTFAIREPDGKRMAVTNWGDTFSRCRWHHVAAVADGSTLRLHLNGKIAGAVAYQGIIRQQLPDRLSIGCQMNREGTDLRSENPFLWNGRIDELAIFNHPLSVDEVRRLYTGYDAVQNRNQ